MANQKSSKGLTIALWVAQVLLAIMFIMSGSMKLFQPIEALSQMLPWVSSLPSGLVRFIGLSELAGGIGVILPAVLRIKANLTSFAAIGLAAVQLSAVFFHLSRGEASVLGVNIVLIGIALFVAWGRIKKAPIPARA